MGDFMPLMTGGEMLQWEYNPENWSLVEGAMRGTGAWCVAYTKQDFGSFRLKLSTRLVAPQEYTIGDHMGVIIWGDRPEEGSYTPAGGLGIQPPYGSIWDYRANLNVVDGIDFVIPKDHFRFDWRVWQHNELYADLATGVVRLAVDGTEIMRWKLDAPDTRAPGPIALQVHNKGSIVEYKDIWIEIDPSSDALTTVMQ